MLECLHVHKKVNNQQESSRRIVEGCAGRLRLSIAVWGLATSKHISVAPPPSTHTIILARMCVCVFGRGVALKLSQHTRERAHASMFVCARVNLFVASLDASHLSLSARSRAEAYARANTAAARDRAIVQWRAGRICIGRRWWRPVDKCNYRVQGWCDFEGSLRGFRRRRRRWWLRGARVPPDMPLLSNVTSSSERSILYRCVRGKR